MLNTSIGNLTNTTTSPVALNGHGIFLLVYFFACIVALIVFAVLIFVGIRKRSVCYLCGSWVWLKLSAWCCRRNSRVQNRVETRAQDLNNLLDDINKV